MDIVTTFGRWSMLHDWQVGQQFKVPEGIVEIDGAECDGTPTVKWIEFNGRPEDQYFHLFRSSHILIEPKPFKPAELIGGKA